MQYLSGAIAHSFDIIIILGNLLENAIEAARQTEERLLIVNIQFMQGVLKINIENSYSGNLLLRKNKNVDTIYLASTKKNSLKHGIGISSVKKIVDKYNGILKIDQKDMRFNIKLILYISEVETEVICK